MPGTERRWTKWVPRTLTHLVLGGIEEPEARSPLRLQTVLRVASDFDTRAGIAASISADRAAEIDRQAVIEQSPPNVHLNQVDVPLEDIEPVSDLVSEFDRKSCDGLFGFGLGNGRGGSSSGRRHFGFPWNCHE